MARKKRWIQRAIRHPGALTAKAKRAHMSVAQYIRTVKAHPGRYSTRTRRQAALGARLRKMRRNR